MKEKGMLVAFGSTGGVPVLYTLGITRLIRAITAVLGAAALLFSAGLFVGRFTRLFR